MARSAPVEPRRARAARTPARRAAWDELNREIITCTLCHLARTRTHAAPYRGGTNPRVVFVGEAPGRVEDLQGLPFVGRAGRLLDGAIAELGLAPEEVGIFNLIKCRPPENVFDRRAEKACRPYLDRQLALLRPRLAVALGARALSALVPGAPGLMKVAGSTLPGPDRPVVPLVHPAATFRSPVYAERWRADLVRLRQRLPELLAEPP
jgi:uracil-DNA glycosylase family 4